MFKCLVLFISSSFPFSPARFLLSFLLSVSILCLFYFFFHLSLLFCPSLLFFPIALHTNAIRSSSIILCEIMCTFSLFFLRIRRQDRCALSQYHHGAVCERHSSCVCYSIYSIRLNCGGGVSNSTRHFIILYSLFKRISNSVLKANSLSLHIWLVFIISHSLFDEFTASSRLLNVRLFIVGCAVLYAGGATSLTLVPSSIQHTSDIPYLIFWYVIYTGFLSVRFSIHQFNNFVWVVRSLSLSPSVFTQLPTCSFSFPTEMCRCQ